MTAGKTIVLTRGTFVGEVMSLLFHMLSRLVIAFLPRSKHLLILWLHSPSAVTLEAKKIKLVTVCIVSSSICHEVMGPDAMILVFFECWVLNQLFHSPLSLSSSLGFSMQQHWSGLPFPSPVTYYSRLPFPSPVTYIESEKWKWSCSVVSDPQPPHELQLSRLLCPWDFPGKSTGVGCHCLLQLHIIVGSNWLFLSFLFQQIF